MKHIHHILGSFRSLSCCPLTALYSDSREPNNTWSNPPLRLIPFLERNHVTTATTSSIDFCRPALAVKLWGICLFSGVTVTQCLSGPTRTRSGGPGSASRVFSRQG